MFRSVNLYIFWLVSLCTVLVVGITGCGEGEDKTDEGNAWVGTWSLESIDGASIQAQFEAIELLFETFGETEVDFSYTDEWTFDEAGMWHRKVTYVAPDEDNIVETSSIEVMGTYSLSDSRYTVTPTSIQEPQVATGDAAESEILPIFGYKDADNGTWLINGDTLTLTSNTGQVYGLNKK